MNTSNHLKNIIAARVNLLKSMESTIDEAKRKEIENILLDVERSLSRCIDKDVSNTATDELIFYEPEDDSYESPDEKQ